jgi:hypothetical protein
VADDWRAEIRLGLEDLVDKAVVTGATQADVFAVLEAEIARLRIALDRDPDPAEDSRPEVPDEPANDWPAAARD